MSTLLWIQTGGCSGDSMSLLNSDNPNLLETLEYYGIELLWHPSLSLESPLELNAIIEKVISDNQEVTFLCVEGAVIMGPEGTGMYDSLLGKPKKDIITALCSKASYVIGMGTCASYGGITAAHPNPTDAVGLQWYRDQPGGLLGQDWRSSTGLPVVNVAGCPAHPNTMVQILLSLSLNSTIELDHFNRPKTFYNTMVHQGCTRNEYHEYDMEETDFGKLGCLFFNLGCQGPLTQSICNSTLWNRQNSKTRAGVPCFGCTTPTFPMNKDFFVTDKIGDIPVKLPLGVKRPNYMAYKGLAKAATPQRLNDRETEL